MAETPPVRKFMFDKSFDAAGATRTVERPRTPVTLRPEQVDQLKKEFYDAGFAAGQKAQGEEQAQRHTATFSRLEEQMTRMVENMQLLHEKHDNQLRNVVLTVVRKVLPGFMARQGAEEIKALLADIMGEMAHEPRLVVRVNEAQFDTISTKVNDIATQKAYPGKVVVLADAQIAAGDCRVEWADGGIERKATETLETVEKIMDPEGNIEIPEMPDVSAAAPEAIIEKPVSKEAAVDKPSEVAAPAIQASEIPVERNPVPETQEGVSHG